MKILMLGWEYPPHIAGGLGIACQGLTKALARLGVDITFVVPRLYGDEDASHMTLKDPYGELAKSSRKLKGKVSTISIPALLNPYWDEDGFNKYVAALKKHVATDTRAIKKDAYRSIFPNLSDDEFEALVTKIQNSRKAPDGHYGKNIFEAVVNFTDQVVAIMSNEECDIIHAHDWMTYPAGVALSKILSRPLVAHIHSLEYDRSGAGINPRINLIEELGLISANAVIAVSNYTKSIVHSQHNVPVENIHVVHNGILPRKNTVHYAKAKHKWPGKVVLFLGRVTYQKGPEYFVRAAAKVVPHVPDVLFVMAGTGDMLPRMISLTKELGIDQNFSFTGFVKGHQLEEVLSVADLYVMPSVSEPFGISALEAIDFDTPAIISKQSGVAEVLSHSLKFDFWDVDRLADFMINGLVHKELREDLLQGAKQELLKLRWDAAALKTLNVYKSVMSDFIQCQSLQSINNECL